MLYSTYNTPFSVLPTPNLILSPSLLSLSPPPPLFPPPGLNQVLVRVCTCVYMYICTCTPVHMYEVQTVGLEATCCAAGECAAGDCTSQICWAFPFPEDTGGGGFQCRRADWTPSRGRMYPSHFRCKREEEPTGTPYFVHVPVRGIRVDSGTSISPSKSARLVHVSESCRPDVDGKVKCATLTLLTQRGNGRNCHAGR